MKLFSEEAITSDRQERYKKLVEGGMNEYDAQTESFEPDQIEDVGGLAGVKPDVPYAIFYFTPEEFKLFQEYFKLSLYQENNANNKLLIKFLTALKAAGIKGDDLNV